MGTGVTRDKVARGPVGDRQRDGVGPREQQIRHRIGGALGQGAAARRAHREAARPRQVEEGVGIGVVEVDELGPGGQQQPGRDPEDAEQAGREDDDDRQAPRAARQLEHEEGHGADGQTDTRDGQCPAAIGEPPRPGRDDGLDARGGEERRAQREAAGPEGGQAQRREDVEHAERGRRQRREPHAGQHRALAQRGRRRGEDLRAAGRGHGDRPRAQHQAEEHGGREGRLAPDGRGQRADQRPELDAEDGRAQDPADDLAAALARRLAGHPGHPARPRAPAADALQEAREVDHDDRRAEREGQAADGHERQAGEHGRLHADARGQPAARERPDERPRGVGGGEHAGAVLAEVRTRRRGRAAAA